MSYYNLQSTNPQPSVPLYQLSSQGRVKERGSNPADQSSTFQLKPRQHNPGPVPAERAGGQAGLAPKMPQHFAHTPLMTHSLRLEHNQSRQKPQQAAAGGKARSSYYVNSVAVSGGRNDKENNILSHETSTDAQQADAKRR